MIKIKVAGLRVLAEDGDEISVKYNEYGDITVDTPRACATMSTYFRKGKHVTEIDGEEWEETEQNVNQID